MQEEVYESVRRTRECRIAAAEAQGWTGPWRFGNEHLHGTPPTGKRACSDGDHVPDGIDKIIVGLCAKIEHLTEVACPCGKVAGPSGLCDDCFLNRGGVSLSQPNSPETTVSIGAVLPRFRVMICDQFVDIHATTGDMAKDILLQRIKDGLHELSMIAWQDDG
jgi:hypothetical protein